MAEDAWPYAFRIERSPGGAIVWAKGELDLAASEELKAALVAAAAHHRRIVLDVGDVEFLDGACLGAIIAARKEAGPDIDIVLRTPTRIVTRVLRLAGLDESFEIEAERRSEPPTDANACAEVSPSAALGRSPSDVPHGRIWRESAAGESDSERPAGWDRRSRRDDVSAAAP